MDLDYSQGADTPAVRTGDRDLLSLALMDARNRSLALYAACESATVTEPPAGIDPPLWTLGEIGRFQESWIARNVQRQRGEHCDPTATRLASIDPAADACFDPGASAQAERWLMALPGAEATRQFLLSTLETTLELLENTPGDPSGRDAVLYFYRLALHHEDEAGERLAETAEALGVGHAALREIFPEAPAFALREPLQFPATRWTLGVMPRPVPQGLVFDLERWAHVVPVPPFEIDAQPVTWAQYTEFVEDGGYDEPRWWSPAGRAWLADTGRRVPHHVEQMRHGVLVRRFGELRRVPATQPAMHLTYHEAEAWCRWAGRRLPTEVEWEAAAVGGASRGFRWGEVWEWTASPLKPYPGYTAGPTSRGQDALFGRTQAVRGASFATRARWKAPRSRRGLPLGHDAGFIGFRSCAL